MQEFPRNMWTWNKCMDMGVDELQALVIDFQNRKMLAKREGDIWVLPGFLDGERELSSDLIPEYVIEKVQSAVGAKLDLCVLREVWREEMEIVVCGECEEDDPRQKSVVLIEHVGDRVDASDSKGFSWRDLGSVEVFHLSQDAKRRVSDEIMFAQRSSFPENRLDWQRPGWLRKTLCWMKEVLRLKLGAIVLNPTSFERFSPYGVVVKAQTNCGLFFLKCTPLETNDAAFSKALSLIAPKYVTEPLAVDRIKVLMITADYGQVLEPGTFEWKDQEDLSVDYANLQKETCGRTDELVSAGMPDMSPETVIHKLEWILSHPLFCELEEQKNYCFAASFFREYKNAFMKDVRTLCNTELPLTLHTMICG